MRSESSGKLVDTWVYAYSGRENAPVADGVNPLVRDQKVRVRVYLVKTLEECDAPPHKTGSVKFRVECDAPKFMMIGTEIELLRQAVWSCCDDHYAIQWTPYFLVEVMNPSIYGSDDGSGLEVTYREVEKGVAHDGTLLLRDDRHGHRLDSYSIKAWPGEFTDDRGKIIACIPATKQNKAALKEFSARIDTLREMLAKMLRPERIEQTLAGLSTISLLSKPGDRTE